VSRPVVRLAEAAARIGRGDLDAPVAVTTRDEVGFLARTLDDMRAALRARDERLQMMLAGIAHEVRNPLGGLELYAGLLRESLGDRPERLEEVRRIEREVQYLKAVVTEFLAYARRAPPELGPVSVTDLLGEVRDLVAAPGVSVEVDAPDGRQAVRADAGQLRRALLNLGRNAVAAAARAHPAGGGTARVVLRARAAADGRVRIEVDDNGAGVEPALREKIFAPFYTTREKGTGLGLAFVREIARDHGSDVRVEDAPGGGARFWFDLGAA
jgi:signal transduction histidine kinase